ncbi:MAG: YceI family protein [Burkholderiaceae bacterium]
MLAALCASAGLAPALAQSMAGPITYQLDPAHTFVTFEVRHFGTSTLRGRIGPVTGEVPSTARPRPVTCACAFP